MQLLKFSVVQYFTKLHIVCVLTLPVYLMHDLDHIGHCIGDDGFVIGGFVLDLWVTACVTVECKSL